MSNISAFEDFSCRIDGYVSRMLDGFQPQPCANKVIHDPIWGSVLYYSWEIQLIDSPLLQRLRGIDQLGLASLTYPSARHSRFEHALGVAHLASEMAGRINQKSIQDRGVPFISDKEVYKLRLAALLHDVGHCFYSHLSESVYGRMAEFGRLLAEVPKFKDAKPHEVFSYLIVNCKTFKQFFKEKICYPDAVRLDPDGFFEEVGHMIIGKANEYRYEIDRRILKKSYMTHIINGAFDADKLDYIKRDSHIAGLALTYDIERFLYKIEVRSEISEVDREEGRVTLENQHLAISVSGVTALEELTFSKLMLYNYIYYHQKVLAAESVMRDVIHGLVRLKKLSHPCDFLGYSDADIERLADCNEVPDERNSSRSIGDIARQITYRRLPKRCLIINSGNLQDEPGSGIDALFRRVDDIAGEYGKPGTEEELKLQIMRLMADFFYREPGLTSRLKRFQRIYFKSRDIYETDLIRKQVYEEMCVICRLTGRTVDFDMYDLQISIPKVVNISKEAFSIPIVVPGGEIRKFSEVVALSDWADSFSAGKWNAYAFCRADLVAAANIAARKVFGGLGVVFNGGASRNLKNSAEIQALESELAVHGYTVQG